MIPHNVVFSPRQGGKTTTIMHEIHQHVIQGRGRDVLVVFPNLDYLNWWVPMWNDRFPHSPMIDYVSVNSTQRIRGKWYAKIYVEDVEAYPDGIYDYRLRELIYALRSHYGDEEMIFTCSPHPFNGRSHNRVTTAERIKARRMEEIKYQRHLVLARMLAHMEDVNREED